MKNFLSEILPTAPGTALFPDDKWVLVNIAKQSLLCLKGLKTQREYLISSAKAGLGEMKNSYQTPRGWHCIRAKVGAGLPMNSVMCERRATGEVYSPELALRYPDRDWILTRILWLSGLEVGKNRLNQVDTMQRTIYIHGTPDSEPMGTPGSHGCLRMYSHDICELFDWAPVLTPIMIKKAVA